MKTVRVLLSACSFLLLVAAIAAAHGGGSVPVQDVPETKPSGPKPLPTPAGTRTLNPDTGVPRNAPGTGGATTPSTPDGGTAGTPGGSSWIWWWKLNGEEILGVRAAVRRKIFRSATQGEDGEDLLASARKKVVPAARQVLELDGADPDLKAAAVIALARCGGVSDLHLILRLAENPEGRHDALVEESAALSLGILGVRMPVVRDLLIRIATADDRRTRTRCFAALALGLLREDSDETFAALEGLVGRAEAANDVRVCALLAMGLVGDSRRAPVLAKWIAEGRVRGRKLSEIEQAHVVGALGRTRDPAALPIVSRTLRTGARLPRRSALIALGQIVPRAPEEARLTYTRLLATHCAGESDVEARNLGLISLGRIGGRPDAGEDVRRICRQALLAAYRRSKFVEKPFAALALGLLGLGDKKDSELRYALAKEIRTDLVKGKDAKSVKEALALALGMLGDPEAVLLLEGFLEDRAGDPGLRVFATTALGMIGDPGTLPTVLRALGQERDRAVRLACAVSAALIGGPRSLDGLLKALKDDKASQYFLGSTALALGRVGELRAVDPLLAIVEPKKVRGRASDLLRGFSLVALGQIAARENVPVLGRIGTDLNYFASVPAIDEVVTIN
ncbi:MAG: HEAT repeat domain-containing protein [Planctomycetota bacterium]|jgi:HEAT repeat protein